MFIGAPRSGTAWAANWATTGGRLCLHDPLWDFHYDQLDALEHVSGISCTGCGLYPDWLNAHPARKVILHRDYREVNASLEAMGLHHCPAHLFANLKTIKGMHVHWRQLFDDPKPIHQYLLGGKFDKNRHALLKGLSVTAKWKERTQNPDVMLRLLGEKHETPGQ
jgi:hypothetical protein